MGARGQLCRDVCDVRTGTIQGDLSKGTAFSCRLAQDPMLPNLYVAEEKLEIYIFDNISQCKNIKPVITYLFKTLGNPTWCRTKEYFLC